MFASRVCRYMPLPKKAAGGGDDVKGKRRERGNKIYITSKVVGLHTNGNKYEKN
jgi:hypothetical protein